MVRWLNRFTGLDLVASEITEYAIFEHYGWDEELYLAAYEQAGEALHREADPYPQAVAVMQRLLQRYQVSFLTARPDCYAAVSRTWLETVGLPSSGLVCQRDKLRYCREQGVTWLVEDAPHYAREFIRHGRGIILMDQPYNRHVRHRLVQRIAGWHELENLLLPPAQVIARSA